MVRSGVRNPMPAAFIVVAIVAGGRWMMTRNQPERLGRIDAQSAPRPGGFDLRQEPGGKVAVNGRMGGQAQQLAEFALPGSLRAGAISINGQSLVAEGDGLYFLATPPVRRPAAVEAPRQARQGATPPTISGRALALAQVATHADADTVRALANRPAATTAPSRLYRYEIAGRRLDCVSKFNGVVSASASGGFLYVLSQPGGPSASVTLSSVDLKTRRRSDVAVGARLVATEPGPGGVLLRALPEPRNAETGLSTWYYAQGMRAPELLCNDATFAVRLGDCVYWLQNHPTDPGAPAAEPSAFVTHTLMDLARLSVKTGVRSVVSTLAPTVTGPRSPLVAADGAIYVALADPSDSSAALQLYRIDLNGGSPRRLLRLPPGAALTSVAGGYVYFRVNDAGATGAFASMMNGVRYRQRLPG